MRSFTLAVYASAACGLVGLTMAAGTSRHRDQGSPILFKNVRPSSLKLRAARSARPLTAVERAAILKKLGLKSGNSTAHTILTARNPYIDASDYLYDNGSSVVDSYNNCYTYNGLDPNATLTIAYNAKANVPILVDVNVDGHTQGYSTGSATIAAQPGNSSPQQSVITGATHFLCSFTPTTAGQYSINLMNTSGPNTTLDIYSIEITEVPQ